MQEVWGADAAGYRGPDTRHPRGAHAYMPTGLSDVGRVPLVELMRPRQITVYGSVCVIQTGPHAPSNEELAEDEKLRQELQRDLAKRLEAIRQEYASQL